MTKLAFAAAAVGAACLAPAALAQTERSLDLRDFDAVVVEGVYDVDVEVGPDFAVTLTGKEKWLDLTEVRVDGSTLVLAMKDTKRGKRIGGNHDGVEAVVTLPALRSVALTGVGEIDARGIGATDFEATLEGVGNVELSGTCETLNAYVEGVGSLEARGLECSEVEVAVEGIGSAEVYASDAVDAEMEGIGSIDVWGKPGKVAKSKTFLSSVTIH